LPPFASFDAAAVQHAFVDWNPRVSCEG